MLCHSVSDLNLDLPRTQIWLSIKLLAKASNPNIISCISSSVCLGTGRLWPSLSSENIFIEVISEKDIIL